MQLATDMEQSKSDKKKPSSVTYSLITKSQTGSYSDPEEPSPQTHALLTVH
jgi:hypothetical protein